MSPRQAPGQHPPSRLRVAPWGLLVGAALLAACGPVGNPSGPLQPEPSEPFASEGLGQAGEDLGAEPGVPTPAPPPALSPLLRYWEAWPTGPGFLEAPLSGAARARLAFGPGPDGPVGWHSDAAAQAAYDWAFGEGVAPQWPIPKEARVGEPAGLQGSAPRLVVVQALAVEVEGDGDGRPEADERLLLSFAVENQGTGSTTWQRARVQFAEAELQASGHAHLPPHQAGKSPIWCLPPHPTLEAFRCTLKVGKQAPPLPWRGALVVEEGGRAPLTLPFSFAPRRAAEEGP